MMMMQAHLHHDNHYQKLPYQQHHKQYHHLFVTASLWLILILACDHAAVRAQLTPAQQACVGPLEDLLVCLPYSQGKSPLPSPSCCTNVANVYHTQKKCLCELIAASFSKTPGLPTFNQTLALALPSVCNVPADPSNCPGDLGIPPSSPEAKIFDNAPGSSLLPSSSTSKGTPSSASVTTAAKGPKTTGSSSGSSSGSSANSKEVMKAAPLLLPLSLSLLFRLIM